MEVKKKGLKLRYVLRSQGLKVKRENRRVSETKNKLFCFRDSAAAELHFQIDSSVKSMETLLVVVRHAALTSTVKLQDDQLVQTTSGDVSSAVDVKYLASHQELLVKHREKRREAAVFFPRRCWFTLFKPIVGCNHQIWKLQMRVWLHSRSDLFKCHILSACRVACCHKMMFIMDLNDHNRFHLWLSAGELQSWCYSQLLWWKQRWKGRG